MCVYLRLWVSQLVEVDAVGHLDGDAVGKDHHAGHLVGHDAVQHVAETTTTFHSFNADSTYSYYCIHTGNVFTWRKTVTPWQGSISDHLYISWVLVPLGNGWAITERRALTGTRNSSMGPPWRINPTIHHTMSEHTYHGATVKIFWVLLLPF